MKTKVALISTGVLVSAVAYVHVTHHCPLHDLTQGQSKTVQAAPAQSNTDAKPGTVVLR